jgi:probable rRNA maturation factor
VDPISAQVHIAIEDSRWRVALQDDIQSVIESYIITTLNHPVIVERMPKQVEVSVVLTNDEDIKCLNRDYRGNDKPTNVLSFPQEADIASMKNFDACALLGDIVLSIETIQKEALQQQKPMHHHLAHLIVHGTLHLIGYDHESDKDATVMESLEISILQQLSVSNPYEVDNS